MTKCLKHSCLLVCRGPKSVSHQVVATLLRQLDFCTVINRNLFANHYLKVPMFSVPYFFPMACQKYFDGAHFSLALRGEMEEIKESVKEGIIERIDEYKYLGWWFREANNIRRQLHEIKSRSGYMVREIKIMGDKTRVGRPDGRIQKMLYEKVVLPTITYNMESTTNMTNKGNGGHGNDTRENVEENIHSTSINPILGVTD